MLPRRLRSLLFAPAVRPDLLRKMPRTARRNRHRPGGRHSTRCQGHRSCRDALGGRRPGRPAPILVRVNDDTTPWHDDDRQPSDRRTRRHRGAQDRDHRRPRLARGRLNDRGLDMPVIGGVETALGVADASPFSPTTWSAPPTSAPRTSSPIWAGCAQPPTTRSPMRAQLALAGRLADVTVIDQIVADFTDDDRCRRECLQARAMGYGGKLCVHYRKSRSPTRPSSRPVKRSTGLADSSRRTTTPKHGGGVGCVRRPDGRRAGRSAGTPRARPGRRRSAAVRATQHECVSHGATHEDVVLVEHPVLERDHALVRPRRRRPMLRDLGLGAMVSPWKTGAGKTLSSKPRLATVVPRVVSWTEMPTARLSVSSGSQAVSRTRSRWRRSQRRDAATPGSSSSW